MQKKIKGYIFEINETIANEQVIFDAEINATLKKAQMLFKDEINNTASFKAPDPNKVSFQNYIGSEKGKNQQMSAADRGSMLAILDNNISPKHSFKSNHESTRKGADKSNMSKILNKIFKVEDPKKTQENVVKLIEDLQTSLTLSEREAILYTIANQKEPNKTTNDIKLEDLLAVSSNQGKNFSSISQLFLPNSAKKKMGNKSLYTELKIEEVNIDEPNPKLNETMKVSTLQSRIESLESEEPSKTFNLKDELQLTSAFKPPVSSQNKTNNKRLTFQSPPIDTIPENPFVQTHLKSNAQAPGFSDLRNKILRDNISPILPKCDGQKINKKIDFDEDSIQEESKRITGKLTFSEKSLEDDNMPSSERNLNRDVKLMQSTEVTKLDKIEESSPQKQQTMVNKKIAGKYILNEKEVKTKKSGFCFNFCGKKKH